MLTQAWCTHRLDEKSSSHSPQPSCKEWCQSPSSAAHGGARMIFCPFRGGGSNFAFRCGGVHNGTSGARGQNFSGEQPMQRKGPIKLSHSGVAPSQKCYWVQLITQAISKWNYWQTSRPLSLVNVYFWWRTGMVRLTNITFVPSGADPRFTIKSSRH